MQASDLKEKDLLELLPEINLIADKELKEKCLKTMLSALKLGGWTKENIALCPVSLTKVKNKELLSQFDHVRAVTKIALNMFENLTEIYKKDRKSKDYIIAGAILHDVGKFTEFISKNGTAQYSDNAKLIRHPLSGAILGAQEGLPDEIVHIIAVHSFEGKESYESLESIIIKASDEAAFKYITFFNN
jgi:putative nucleotidyltransferase with HDIG domain